MVTAASNVSYTTLGSFSATSPLTYNSATGVFAINKATTLADGYLSSTDWNTFNNKVGSITLNTPSSVFSNPINFSVTAGAATGTLSLNTQVAGTVFAGPANGIAATPTFRALVASDIPSLAGSYIQNQTIQQASSNFNISGNGTIGTNLSVTGTSILTGLLTSNGGQTNSGAFTSSGGIVNMNANSNFATNINTGISTGTLTLGNALNNINLPKLSASSVVLTDASKNLTSTTPLSNTYLYYNGTNFTWTTAASSLASLTNGAGIASLNYNGSSAATVSLANGTTAGQIYVTGATPFTPSLVTMGGDATISSAGALTLATVNGSVGTFNNVTVNAKGLITAASNVSYTTSGSFSATSPLTYNSATGVFAISKATTLADGYLSSTDWNTFNNKIGSITLNTPSSVFSNPINFSVVSGAATGTLSLNTQTANTIFAGPASGSAAAPAFRTLVAADIPSLSGLYIQNQTIQQASSNFNISGNGTVGTNLSVTGISTLTGLLTSNGGQTNSGAFTSSGGIVNMNAGSNFATNINTGTSTGSLTLGNSLNNILLPKFNTAGGMFFTSAASGQIDNTGTDMKWDDVNNRLGIGTTTPGSTLDVKGILRLSASTGASYVAFQSATGPGSTTYTWPSQDGANGQSLVTNGSGTLSWTPALTANGAWTTSGNTGINANNNFIGTKDANDFVTRTNNSERMRVTSAGDVVIGSGDNSGSPTSGILRGPSSTGGNKTGADLNIQSGNGTGNGGSGDIILSTGAAGSNNGSGADVMSEKMRITDAGVVGIGTSSPNASTKLDVAGSVKIGASGTAIKSIQAFATTINQLIAAGGATQVYATITIPTALSSTQAVVTI